MDKKDLILHLEDKLKNYLDNLEGYIFYYDDFIDKLDEFEKKYMKKLYKKIIYIYMLDNNILILQDEKNPKKFIKLTKEESKIIYILKKYSIKGFENIEGDVLPKEHVEIIFSIYKSILDKNLLNELIEKKIISKSLNDTCYLIRDVSCGNLINEYDNINIFEYIGKNLDLEYLKEYRALAEKFNEITINLSKTEKTIEKLNKENEVLKKKYENSTLYSISTMGIFLAIFSLISINSTFIYEIMKNESLTSKAGLILLVNGVLLTGLISLVTLIKSLFEVNSDQNIFSKLGGKAIIIPVVLCVLGLLFIA